MTLVLGVGIGLFILVGIWLTCLAACFISKYAQRNVGLYAAAIATKLSLIIIFIPRESEKPGENEQKVYDTLFFWRIALLLLLIVCAVGGGIFYLLNHLMGGRIARPIKRWSV